ncbi:MAG: arginine deiminase family protein [Acidobacteriota bacterium]
MRLNVTSEVGKLKSVLVHLPGREIDVMSPRMMEDLLFDDILYGQLAREEHRRFQQIMRYVVEDVYDIQDLLEEIFEEPEQKRLVVADFCKRSRLSPRLCEELADENAAHLAEIIIGGIVTPQSARSGELPGFVLAPVPNLFFMRDPQTVIGDGVAICAMATAARQRESLLSHYVFKHHRDFRRKDVLWMDPWETPPPRVKGARKPTIEGGDVLVARRDLLVVGISARTNRAGIEYLADSLKASGAGVKTIIMVEIPRLRSFMHLDTVFTIISENEALVYPPVVFRGGGEEAKVYQVDLTKRQTVYSSQKSLMQALKKKGMDLEPISCGGDQPINQQREQWTDGANAFVLAPGIILLYDRNTNTADELTAHGYEVVYEDDLLLGRSELETWTDKKYAIQIQGHELSRARGGPRCMTMPLEREEL